MSAPDPWRTASQTHWLAHVRGLMAPYAGVLLRDQRTLVAQCEVLDHVGTVSVGPGERPGDLHLMVVLRQAQHAGYAPAADGDQWTGLLRTFEARAARSGKFRWIGQAPLAAAGGRVAA